MLSIYYLDWVKIENPFIIIIIYFQFYYITLTAALDEGAPGVFVNV